MPTERRDLRTMKCLLDDGLVFEDAIDMYIDLVGTTWRQAYAIYRTIAEPPFPYGEVRAYDEAKDNIIFNLRLLGATNPQICEALSISGGRLERWMQDYPDFKQAYDAGGVEANAFVAQSLYKRARGYKVKEAKIATHEGVVTDVVYVDKEIPPDVHAIKWWLRNKARTEWNDEQRVHVNNINSDSGLSEEELTLRLQQAGFVQEEGQLSQLTREPIPQEEETEDE